MAYCKEPGKNAHGEIVYPIGPSDPDFLGEPEDEILAGEVYNNLPSYPFMNQVNRHEAVRIIAEALRVQIKKDSEIVLNEKSVVQKIAWGDKATEKPDVMSKSCQLTLRNAAKAVLRQENYNL